MADSKTIYQKLTAIQNELKVSKGQYNSFGKYKYRSCEDILEALKPLLKKHDLSLVITDTVQEVGGRIYVTAQTRLTDGKEFITNTGFAREAMDKKGMDDSQITGTASSYARKYALNGLFLIDDTKDADTDEYRNQNAQVTKSVQPTKITKESVEARIKKATQSGVPVTFIENWTRLNKISPKDANEAIQQYAKEEKEKIES